MTKFYITTAIDYVNAKPHIGHAYEKVVTDVLARWHRLLGDEVFFLTGTDENAQKNAQAAKESGEDVESFVDKNSEYFKKLCKILNISNDYFIKTTEKRHVEFAQLIFKKLFDKGDIYKGHYEGLYCNGCEAYFTEKDLVDGKCPEHNKKPEWIKQESYFFKLGKYKDKVLKLIKSKDFILPESKKNEIVSRVEAEGLKDLCVSRYGAEWGVDVPFDKKHKIYVWIDALNNYISALDYPDGKNFKKFWPADVHVIGKGINFFHSVIWPAILFAAGINRPKKILVHGYLTFEGKKISKSLGTSINPEVFVKKYGADALRYFLLRHIPFGDDGDFSEEALKERYNGELANKVGNLVSRISTLAEKYGLEKSEPLDIKELKKNVEGHFKKFELDKVLGEIFGFVDYCNEYVQEKKPWETKDKKVLYQLVNAIKDFTILLSPFIPEACDKIAKTFNFSINYKEVGRPIKISKIKKGEILFKKVD